MAVKGKKYNVAVHPPSPSTMRNIDDMFDDLYHHLLLSTTNLDDADDAFTKGDLLYWQGDGLGGLAAVATGSALISQGVETAPSWGDIDLTTTVTGILPVANGGTGSSTFAAGSILFSNGTIITEDNTGLFYRDSTNALGLGTAVPTRQFHLHHTSTPVLHLTTDTTGQAITDGLDLFISSGVASLFYRESNTLTLATNATDMVGLYASGGISLLAAISDPGAGIVEINGTVKIDTPLGVLYGGTGTATAFTQGSVVFAGASGIYTQDNANFFWDDTSNNLGIGTATPFSGWVNTVISPGIHIRGTAPVLGLTDSDGGDQWALTVVSDGRFIVRNETDDLNPLTVISAQVKVKGVTRTESSSAVRGVDILEHGANIMGLDYYGGTVQFHIPSRLKVGGSVTVATTREFTIAGTAPFAAIVPTTGTNGAGWEMINTGNTTYIGITNSAGTTFGFSESAYSTIFGSSSARSLHFITNSIVRGSFDSGGNFLLGTVASAPSPSTGTLGLVFGDGTALASMGSNTAGLYADDVGGTVQMFGISEAGSVSQLTGVDIRKTADETVTDTTIQADDHLITNLAASSSYSFRFTIFFTNAGAAEGIQLDLNGTVGVSSLKAQVSIYDDTLNTLAAFARVEALASAVGAGLSIGDNFAVIEGTIETSTAGTFGLRFAQNATGASAGVTVEENSTLTLRKLNA